MIIIFIRVGLVFLMLAATIGHSDRTQSGGMALAGKGEAAHRADIVRWDTMLSWDDYWIQLEDTRQEISELEQSAMDPARDRLEAIAQQWEAITTVALPDGTQIAVDHSFLVSLLRSSPPDLARIVRLLAALLAEQDNFIEAQNTSADLQSLKRILAQSEFQWKEQNAGQPGALEKLWQRIQQELGELARKLLGFNGANYILGIGALLLLSAMLLYLFRNLLLSFVAEARVAPLTRAGDEVLTADTALKRAQELSRGGDNRSAVRYLYLSALLLLEERGLLGYDRTKTNREYLLSVRDLPELETSLRYVVEVFDRVWYGYQPLDAQDYQYYERQVGKLRQQRQIIQPKNEGG
jgi:hypothetical protein